jgi:hypothetical protein
MLGIGACGDANAPHLDSVSPSTVAIGQNFTLHGERFCQQAGVNSDGTCMTAVSGEVDLAVDQPTQCPIVSWTDTTVVASVPPHPPTGSSEVFLTSSGESSNALDIVVQ